MKNPEYKQAATNYFAARKALEIPKDISGGEIQQLVRRLFVQEDNDFNFERLKLVGEKAVPALIEPLNDPKTASTHFGDGDHLLDAKSPFERISVLLNPIGPPDAVRSLARYIDHNDDGFRKFAAIALGNIGTSECIAPMLKVFDNDDAHVCSFAMMGIDRGMNANRCTEDFLNAMFPALTMLLNRDDSSTSGKAPKLLLAIDTDRAVPVLLSPEYFTIGNANVHDIIRALNEAGIRIPHETLLPFIDATRPHIAKYPYYSMYAAALIAYAHNPNASAELTFRAELKSSNKKRVQEAAAEALAILSGVANARDLVYKAHEILGFDGLSPPLKDYYAVSMYDAEVNNGGHAQYFVNSSGDRWNEAIEGLNAIGAIRRAKILHEATALFGSDRPSRDEKRRHRQLAGFSAQQDKSLDELDRRSGVSEENIEVMLAQYAIEHAEHFVPQT
ncbi:MAG: DUF4375 domain-containing protein [Planctomycetota bacterium]|nr:DUF4375 domain-containing protein [Planctomycetota bacterium]